jgi:hypothetical protein
MSKKVEKKCFVGKKLVETLAYCEWRAAAAGLKPLRLPRAPKTRVPENQKS